MNITVNFEAVLCLNGSTVFDEDVQVDVDEDFFSWTKAEQDDSLVDDYNAWIDNTIGVVLTVLTPASNALPAS